jgi:glycosyltransferase involved in cell wall biosynthesis
MKILMVSRSVLPYPGGSSVIVEQLAQNFSRDELVVLGGAPFFQQKTLERPASSPEFIYFPCEFTLWGRGYHYFKWMLRWQFRPLINKIKQLVAEHQIDYIIGVFPTDFFCHAACRAAQELGIPFSSYFHNTYLENAKITDPKAPAIQAEIFENSEHIFVMSKGMQTFYEEKYGLSKFVPLVHTFDNYPDPNALTGIPGVQKERYRLVAIGNFNESNMDASSRLVRALKNNPKYELHLYTHVPELLLQQRGLDTSGIHHEGFVRPEEVHEKLQQYDICVLTHGFTGDYGEVEYRTIFPTRTIPFLLSGKPIFAHSPPASFLNDFIHENKCAELVDTADEEAIIAGLDRITNNLNRQHELVAAAAQTAQQFYGPEVVKVLQDRITKDI